MFIKKITNRKAGKTYVTYRLVASKRVNGIPRHIPVLDLGSLPGFPVEKHKLLADRIGELIGNQLDILPGAVTDGEVEELAQYFYRKLVNKQLDHFPLETSHAGKKEFAHVDLESFESVESKEIGGEWLCVQAFEELGLPGFLSVHAGLNGNEVSVSLLSLAGRMLHPASERETAKWLNENSAAFELVCPQSGTVDRNRLTQATLSLYQNKDAIEDYLSGKVHDIFGLEDKYFLYDLTNTHFEGKVRRYPKAKYGRNKQKRNDCLQVTLGLLTDGNGLPRRSRYYPGNVGEVTTFSHVLDDLEKEAKHKRPVIVMDSGIASEDNLKAALSRGFDYICVSRSGHADLLEKINPDQLKTFTNKSKEEVQAQFFNRELTYEKNGVPYTHKEQVLYVQTEAKKGKETAMIGKKRQRFETGMEVIASSLEKPGAVKTAEKINQRIGRLKEKCKGISGYYDITVQEEDGKAEKLSWKYNPGNRAEKKAGKYFIRTSIEEDREQTLWKLYRVLGEIESSFKLLKSDLDMRPVFTRK